MKELLFVIYPMTTLMLSVTKEEEEEIRAYDIPEAVVMNVNEMMLSL